MRRKKGVFFGDERVIIHSYNALQRKLRKRVERSFEDKEVNDDAVVFESEGDDVCKPVQESLFLSRQSIDLETRRFLFRRGELQ